MAIVAWTAACTLSSPRASPSTALRSTCSTSTPSSSIQSTASYLPPGRLRPHHISKLLWWDTRCTYTAFETVTLTQACLQIPPSRASVENIPFCIKYVKWDAIVNLESHKLCGSSSRNLPPPPPEKPAHLLVSHCHLVCYEVWGEMHWVNSNESFPSPSLQFESSVDISAQYFA